MTIPDDLDRRLRVTIASCPVEHYLSGNPHTFRGRIATWCSGDTVGVNISKGDITSSTEEAKYWIDGFLAGNEPPPPDSGDPVAERAWEATRSLFRMTGELPRS